MNNTYTRDEIEYACRLALIKLNQDLENTEARYESYLEQLPTGFFSGRKHLDRKSQYIRDTIIHIGGHIDCMERLKSSVENSVRNTEPFPLLDTELYYIREILESVDRDSFKNTSDTD